mgnify:CR=1 FL=1
MPQCVWGGGILLLSSEVALREIWGFCDAPLSIESERYEYIFAPNQDRFRFGKHVRYNSFSQRSEEPKKGKKKKVLGCGDSVINGGSLTDQKDLATTLFEEMTGVQMLNISAGSWGPDNCAAYIEEKGTFDAEGIILVVSSHDAHDNMNFQPVVGQSVAFPKKQYTLAIVELVDRYLVPRVSSMFKSSKGSSSNPLDPDAAVNAGIQKSGKEFNPGFGQLKEIADSCGMWFSVYLHPEKNEVEAGAYNTQGEEIIAWARANDVPLYLGLEEGEALDGFRDNIHLNELGQQRLAECFKKIYKEW